MFYYRPDEGATSYTSGSSTALEEDSWAGIGWRLHFGRVLKPNSLTPGETQIEMGDGSRHALHTTTAYPEGWMTANFWVYDRGTHTLKLPNGHVYVFGREVYLNARLGLVRYVTEIRDLFNNRLTFAYFDDPGPRDGVREIRQGLGASQERLVTFTYDATLKSLETMQYLDRTWTYTHEATGPPGHSVLKGVQPPTGRPWLYHYTSGLPGELTITITPTGGRGDYAYVDKDRRAGAVSTTARVVAERRVRDDVGHILTPGTWTFTYGAGDNQDTTVVASPCGTTTYRFLGTGLAGDFSAWSAGALAEQTIAESGVVLERQAFTWQRSEPISPDPVPGSQGNWSDPNVARPLLRVHTTTRGSQSWTTTMDYHPAAFNDYGQPFRITETGELTRITERAFEDRFYPHITPRIRSEEVRVGTQTVTITWTYDLYTGFMKARTGPGAPASFDPTVHGNVGISTDALGHRTTYTYAWGAVASVTTPHTTTTFGINPDGTIEHVQTGSLVTRYTYD